MYNGIINIYKEKGYTSHDVVAKLRGIVKQKKIGHTGTLDPDAEGVLPVCLGTGTKLCDMLTDQDKEYQALLLLGVSTDTQDMTGTVLKKAPVAASPEEVRAAILSFTGSYKQLPPMYSAVKVNGRRLYELAREGKEVERRARNVQIHSIQILSMELPEIRIQVVCSKGTYIRTLCHDIGETLGCGGCMAELTRTRAGAFLIKEALTLEEIKRKHDNGELNGSILSVEDALSDYPAYTVKAAFDKLLYNGNPLDSRAFLRPSPMRTVPKGSFELAGGETCPARPEMSEALSESTPARVFDSRGKFIGVYEYRTEKGAFYPLKMFLEAE